LLIVACSPHALHVTLLAGLLPDRFWMLAGLFGDTRLPAATPTAS
jgi:hypothetical protein